MRQPHYAVQRSYYANGAIQRKKYYFKVNISRVDCIASFRGSYRHPYQTELRRKLVLIAVSPFCFKFKSKVDEVTSKDGVLFLAIFTIYFFKSYYHVFLISSILFFVICISLYKCYYRNLLYQRMFHYQRIILICRPFRSFQFDI